jgi:hypothetical protein
LRQNKGYNNPLLTLFEMKNFEEFTVNEIIRSDYRARLVFKNLGVDFSTENGMTLQEVCTNHYVSPEIVLEKIIEEIAEKGFTPCSAFC